MSRENDFGTMTYQVLDSGDCSPDPCIISYVEIIIQRHIQVYSHKHSLPFQITLFQLSNTPLGCHCLSKWIKTPASLKLWMKHTKPKRLYVKVKWKSQCFTHGFYIYFGAVVVEQETVEGWLKGLGVQWRFSEALVITRWFDSRIFSFVWLLFCSVKHYQLTYDVLVLVGINIFLFFLGLPTVPFFNFFMVRYLLKSNRNL